jgi:hypothetical protein
LVECKGRHGLALVVELAGVCRTFLALAGD